LRGFELGYPNEVERILLRFQSVSFDGEAAERCSVLTGIVESLFEEQSLKAKS
jgi:hypothetical protein